MKSYTALQRSVYASTPKIGTLPLRNVLPGRPYRVCLGTHGSNGCSCFVLGLAVGLPLGVRASVARIWIQRRAVPNRSNRHSDPELRLQSFTRVALEPLAARRLGQLHRLAPPRCSRLLRGAVEWGVGDFFDFCECLITEHRIAGFGSGKGTSQGVEL